MNNQTKVVPLILGTGNSSTKEYDVTYAVVQECFRNGIYSFDTAPSYKMEELLGRALLNAENELNIERAQIRIQTKVDAWQMQDEVTKKAVSKVISEMNCQYLDAVLIHWPVPDYLEKTWDDLCDLREKGLVKKIGICNLRLRNIKKVLEWEIKPEIIQLERHPLNSFRYEVELCKENNIEVQAYSPLCKMIDEIRNNNCLNHLAEKYNKTVAQIILRWHIQTGVIPVFATTKPSRVKEQAEIDDFILTEDEISAIEMLNCNKKIFLESIRCPGF